jgi:hypothetical protein
MASCGRSTDKVNQEGAAVAVSLFLTSANLIDGNSLNTRIYRRDWAHKQWTEAKAFLKFS